MTDYLILPLIFTTGETHAASWSTKAPGGFDDEAVKALQRLSAPLARLTEIYMLRFNAAHLLSAYVGRDSGNAILNGKVRRGDTDRIESAILFVDLTGFTDLSNRLDGRAVIAVLNRFFEALAPGIFSNGGEILKFMGDGVLAIFPVGDGDASGAKMACGAAHRAIMEGWQRIEEANEEAAESDLPPIAFKASLDYGEVHYGNIGSAERLDFTAIGPTINRGARLLASASDLGEPLVISKRFADNWDSSSVERAIVALKGFQEAVPVYVPHRSISADA